ncbi:MAG: hypothetical protein V9F00_05290 [Nocardioides sp.]
MTDFDALTPAQEAEVRHLLASMRVVDPMPAEVVARLDGVLADLGHEQAAASTPSPTSTDPATAPDATAAAPVIHLAARRRLRILRGLAVAAAVVGVIGVGGPAVLRGIGSSGSDSSAGGSMVQDSGDMPAPEAATTKDLTTPAGGEANAADAISRRVRIRADHVNRDVRRALRTQVSTMSGEADYSALDDAELLASCPLPSDQVTARGLVGYLPVDYLSLDGSTSPGVLALGKRGLESRRVEVWLCGGTAPVAVVRRTPAQ